MKIGNTSFNVEEMKKLSFEEFSAQFKGKLHAPKERMTFEQVYEKVTGKKAEKVPSTKVDGPGENKGKAEKK